MNPQNKLNNQDIDKSLEGTYFKRVGEYVNNCTPIEFLCLKHNNVFKTTWGNLIAKNKKGTGCPECVKEKLRLSNEIIDERLKGRNIKRIGNYITANEKIEWELDDGYRWFATPANILTKTNFKKERKFLSNEIIDQRLKDRNFKRVSEFLNGKSKITFQCLKNDSHRWEATAGNILNGKTGCPFCKKSKGEELIKSLLHTLGVKYEPGFMIRYNRVKKFFVDFYLLDYNLIIEFNGLQHYKPIDFFGGIERFKSQKLRDENLKKYCYINKIRLVEIPYGLDEEKIREIIEKEVSNSQLLLQ